MSNTQPPNLFHEDRQDRLIRESEHDTYRVRKKLTEPTVCPRCDAVYHAGRWQWGARPDDAEEETCPACLRIEDRCPAGFLNLRGAFFHQHKDEISHLIDRVAAQQKAQHALKRIMAVEERGAEQVITFTNPQLARSVGEAIQRAYKGELAFAYQPDEYLLRVTWTR